MYDDRRESFSIKDIFLQLLFIVLLVFILIWLFPTKGYLETKLDGIENNINESLQPLYTRLFTDNILTMKDAAKSYFTTPRLPQKVGDTVKMTLGEMYDKGLLLQLVDSNNNACDTTNSYVEITKTDDEYQLKAVLSCSDKEAYIIEYLGCYDYCNGKLCTKEESATNQSTAIAESKKYRYQYVLTTGGNCSDYGDWSDWTTNKIEENSTTKVDTKTEKVFDHYQQIYGVIDTKYTDETYYTDVAYGYSTRTIKTTTLYNYTTKTTTTIAAYSTRVSTSNETVPYSTKTIKKTTVYDYSTKQVPTGSEWVDAGTVESKTALSSSDTVKYTLTSTRQEFDCNDECAYVNYYDYSVSKLETSYTTEKYCAKGTNNGSGCVVEEYVTQNYCAQGTDNGSSCTVPVNTTIYYCTQGVDNGNGCAISTSERYCAQGTDVGNGCQVITYSKQNYCAAGGTDTGSGCTVKVAKTKKVAQLIYGYTNGDAVYKDVTYYRSASKTCTGGTVDYKWSTSNSDATLKAKGYTLTGVTEEIK